MGGVDRMNHWDDCLEVIERAVAQILVEESKVAGEFPQLQKQLPSDWQDWGWRVASSSEETARA